MKKFSARARTLLAGGALALCAVLSTGAFNEDIFACEEARATLDACCDADHTDVSCGSGCSEVQIGLHSSDCIRNATCEQLRNSGACDDPSHVSCTE